MNQNYTSVSIGNYSKQTLTWNMYVEKKFANSTVNDIIKKKS